MADPKQTKLIQDSLVAGFKGGWRAACETIAGWLSEAMRKSGEDAAEYSVCVADLVKAIRAHADHAPTPGVVEMKSATEPLEEAQARAVRPLSPPETTGPVPTAEESFGHVASILAAFPPSDDMRRARAQWVAVLGFALFSRDCAAMDGVLSDVDREADRLRDLIVGDQPIPRARPLGPEAQA